MNKRNRRSIAALIVLIVALILAGCGKGSADGGDAGASGTAETASAYASSGGPADGTGASDAAQAQQPRIVSTTVAITQIADALGLPLAGIPTSAKQLPARYADVTKIGNPMSPDMEVVKMLKPTAVLSVTTLEYDLKPKFEAAGVQAEFLDLTSIGHMQQAIAELGAKYGRESEAASLNARYDAKIIEAAAFAAGKPSPKVLILMGVPGSYLVATERSYIGDLVRIAGGVNVAQGEKVEYLASNTEYLHSANPDVILRAAHGMPDEVVKMFDQEFKKNDIWKHFDAVKNGRVYDLEESLFGTTASLGADDALSRLLELLYP
ncbi:heme ABC transporter substrate-binding protein IsdE [Cohnella sp. 56]|uniref:heme ABC transporter substrate-binding protein IsdE n=1 Tax=Cohnella sp. 56 TaxID=3113722 RepID=UPI0030E8788C